MEDLEQKRKEITEKCYTTYSHTCENRNKINKMLEV